MYLWPLHYHVAVSSRGYLFVTLLLFPQQSSQRLGLWAHVCLSQTSSIYSPPHGGLHDVLKLERRFTEQAGNAKLQFVESLLGKLAASECVYQENQGEKKKDRAIWLMFTLHTQKKCKKIIQLNAETTRGSAKDDSPERKNVRIAWEDSCVLWVTSSGS